VCKFNAATSDIYAEALAARDYISTSKLWVDIEKPDGRAFLSAVLKITDVTHQDTIYRELRLRLSSSLERRAQESIDAERKKHADNHLKIHAQVCR